MTFTEAVISTIRNGLDFRGRARRDEFVLVTFLGVPLLGLILQGLVIAARAVGSPFLQGEALERFADGLVTKAVLALVVVLTSLHVRRLHDTGRSAMILIVAAGLAGTLFGGLRYLGAALGERTEGLAVALGVFVVALVFACAAALLTHFWWSLRPGDPRPNRYGPPPAEVAS